MTPWKVAAWAGLTIWAVGLLLAWSLCRAADEDLDPEPDDPAPWRLVEWPEDEATS